MATGPRSLNAVTPYIESALSAPGSGYSVKIGSSMLIWGGVLHPLGIRASNVDVLTDSGITVAHFPEIGVEVYLFELFLGRTDIKSIELFSPVTKFKQDEQGNIASFGFSNGDVGAAAPIAAALALLTSDAGDNPITHLKTFTVRNASLSLEDNHGNAILSSQTASIEIVRKPGIAEGKLRMPLQIEGRPGDIEVTFTIDGKQHTVVSSVIFSEIPSGVIGTFAPSQAWMAGVRMPLSGWANMISDFDVNIGAIDFLLEAGQGVIDLPDQFEQPLKPQHIKLAGKLTEKLTLLTVREALLDFGTHSISFSGTVRRQEDDVGVDGDVEVTNISLDDAHYYWPLTLAPHSRHWVTTRLSQGKVTKATSALHFKPGEFKLKNTPEAAVDATIMVKGATIQYKPGHPSITGVDGVVKFTGKSMDATISNAKYLNNTRISIAQARFPDFYPDNVQMFIDMSLDTTARDVQRFLALPDLNKAAKINLTTEVIGQAKGTAKLDFIAFSENDKDDVSATGKINYALNADLVGISQKRFMGNRDIDDANMKISIDNKGMKGTGSAKINTVPMQVTFATSFLRGNETNYTIKADMPIARLPDFGLPKLDFAAGDMGVDATLTSSDTVEKANATLNLTRTSIHLPQHGFIKKPGTKATLKLDTEQLPSGNTLINSFALSGEAGSASGKAEYGKSIGDFKSFAFSPMHIGQHDLDVLTYERSGKNISLMAKGRVFDASPYIKPSGQNAELAYTVDLKTDRLLLGDKREMTAVTVQADCPAEQCRSARINAKLSDGTPFLYTIAGGKLESSCDNAGELARTLAILDTVEGGKMNMKGEYKDGKIEGVLEIRDYVIRRAPVITKIFTIASLTGILDTLSGSGIHFDRLFAPFTYHRGLVVLKGARTHGPALGFTADGSIDTNKSILDLNGVLVPSYTLNSLVGNIPLIGDLISGGKGTGLVALSYGIHGDMKDPAVSVNPLSVFTPGFLRNIFDIFDKPAPDIDAIERARKKENPAATPADEGQKATSPTSSVPAPGQEPPPMMPPESLKLPSVDELQK